MVSDILEQTQVFNLCLSQFPLIPLLLPILNNNALAIFSDNFFLTFFPLELADDGLGDRDIIAAALSGHGQFSDMLLCHGNIITKKYVLCTYFFELPILAGFIIPGQNNLGQTQILNLCLSQVQIQIMSLGFF